MGYINALTVPYVFDIFAIYLPYVWVILFRLRSGQLFLAVRAEDT